MWLSAMLNFGTYERLRCVGLGRCAHSACNTPPWESLRVTKCSISTIISFKISDEALVHPNTHVQYCLDVRLARNWNFVRVPVPKHTRGKCESKTIPCNSFFNYNLVATSLVSSPWVQCNQQPESFRYDTGIIIQRNGNHSFSTCVSFLNLWLVDSTQIFD